MNQTNTRLSGITPAIMTPLKQDGSLDEQGAEKLTKYVLDGGVHNIFALGVCGEGIPLDTDTRKRLVEIIHEQTNGRVPLIVGVFGESTKLVLDNIEKYARGKADYVLCTPPNYLPLSQEECRDFYLSIANESGLPVIIYNCPLNRNNLEPKTIARLAEHPNIVGLKETSTMTHLSNMWRTVGNRDDFTLLSGWEYLFVPALSLGIEGFIMGGPGNMFPGLCVKLLEQYKQGQHEQAVELHGKMLDFMNELYALPCGALPAIKGLLSVMGICGKTMSHPVRTASDEEVKIIEQLMKKYPLFA